MNGVCGQRGNVNSMDVVQGLNIEPQKQNSQNTTDFPRVYLHVTKGHNLNDKFTFSTATKQTSNHEKSPNRMNHLISYVETGTNIPKQFCPHAFLCP